MTSGFSKYKYLKSLHGKKFPSDLHYRILVTLLDYARRDGTGAYPGNARLASDCACHVETVKRSLRWLKARGYVTCVSRGVNGSGASVWQFPDSAEDCPDARTARPAKGSARASFGSDSKDTFDTVSAGFKGSAQVSPSVEEQGDGKNPSNRGRSTPDLAGEFREGGLDTCPFCYCMPLAGEEHVRGCRAALWKAHLTAPVGA